jgi:para-aminobenzoate synthetase/4-amino-4-deoxychorismate lyase
MTSTVEASLAEATPLLALFEALYPCGSITGAPKLRTMEIIHELERDHRGVYTGAIGWFDPPVQSADVPEFCLSVPIRTMELSPEDAAGVRKGRMGIGAGIVLDSNPQGEFQECRLKGSFLSTLPSEFQLIETLRAEGGACAHLPAHLDRLERSARYFRFHMDRNAIEEHLRRKLTELPRIHPWRVRVLLVQDGELKIDATELVPVTRPVRLLLAGAAVDPRDVFLRHKTTVRERYEAALLAAGKLGAFDMLFANHYGLITEGCRSTVFVRLNGRWYTPPVVDGVLPGVMRSLILADPQWAAAERSIRIEELAEAQEIMVCNALHGSIAASIESLQA